MWSCQREMAVFGQNSMECLRCRNHNCLFHDQYSIWFHWKNCYELGFFCVVLFFFLKKQRIGLHANNTLFRAYFMQLNWLNPWQSNFWLTRKRRMIWLIFRDRNHKRKLLPIIFIMKSNSTIIFENIWIAYVSVKMKEIP